MKAYRSIIKTAIKAGYDISVFDGEDYHHKLSFAGAVECLEAVEEARLEFNGGDGKGGSALVLPYEGTAENPCESLADWVVCDFIENWYESYSHDSNYPDRATVPA